MYLYSHFKVKLRHDALTTSEVITRSKVIPGNVLKDFVLYDFKQKKIHFRLN